MLWDVITYPCLRYLLLAPSPCLCPTVHQLCMYPPFCIQSLLFKQILPEKSGIFGKFCWNIYHTSIKCHGICSGRTWSGTELMINSLAPGKCGCDNLAMQGGTILQLYLFGCQKPVPFVGILSICSLEHNAGIILCMHMNRMVPAMATVKWLIGNTWIMYIPGICGSCNGLVLSGNKPLPEPMLTQFHVATWFH